MNVKRLKVMHEDQPRKGSAFGVKEERGGTPGRFALPRKTAAYPEVNVKGSGPTPDTHFAALHGRR